METQFDVPTETYAEKAKLLLARAGIRWSMQRVTGKNGCSFRFTAGADAPYVTGLLTRGRIPYRLV